MQASILSSLIFLPLVASVLIMLLPDSFRFSYKWIGLISLSLMVVNFGTLVSNYNPKVTDYQFIEHSEWIRLAIGKKYMLSIDYILGIDGINIGFVGLTMLVALAAMVVSFSIEKNEKSYYALLNLLIASIMGSFLALDMFLFFIFFEFMLLPMYFLIGIWGGSNRSFAALKFIIYTLVGSVFILAAIIILSLSVSDEFFSNEFKRIVFSFDYRLIRETKNLLPDSLLSVKNPQYFLGLGLRHWVFLMLFLGFGIKLPVFPFHTWLPLAHVEAPTPISVILAGILLKIGGYGFIRFSIGFLPDIATQYQIHYVAIGLISIIYGGFTALGQKDIKKLVAYSSISHMGFVMVGLGANNVEGVSGAIFQMLSHGILSSMLFILVGVLYDQTGSRRIADFKGLANPMPYYAGFASVAFFGSLGLPGLSGFIGEFFSIYGAIASPYIPNFLAFSCIFGIILSAIYFLWSFQKVFFGAFSLSDHLKTNQLTDINQRTFIVLLVLSLFTIMLGVFPQIVFDIINHSVDQLLIKN